MDSSAQLLHSLFFLLPFGFLYFHLFELLFFVWRRVLVHVFLFIEGIDQDGEE